VVACFLGSGGVNEQRGVFTERTWLVILALTGLERSVFGGGCFYDTAYIDTYQVFLNEIFSTSALLFLAYGLGLDPRQAVLWGPRMGPVLVGLALGLVAFATSGIAPGYAGAQMHPARCFAFAVAKRDMTGDTPHAPLSDVFRQDRLTGMQGNGFGGLDRLLRRS
jgi:glycerol uptake facilitator-like aquaporin